MSRRRLVVLFRRRRDPAHFLAPLNGSLAFQDRAGGGTLTGSGAVRYAPASGARVNLINNPSFETGTTGWAVNAGVSFVQSSEQAYAGSSSLKCTVTSAASTSGIINSLTTLRARITPGLGYVGSAYVYNGAAATREFRIRAAGYDLASGSKGVTAGSFVSAPPGQWTRVSVAFTAPAGSEMGALLIEGNHVGGNGIQVGDVFYVDAVQLELGSSPTAYLDGANGGVWLDPRTGYLGTAHQSPSVSQAVAWIAEGTTNTIPDPSFEAASITSNWTASGSATISKVTTHAYLGAASGRVQTTAASGDGINSLNGGAAASGQVWTAQALVRATNAADVGKTVRIGITERTSANAFVAEGLSDPVALTDQWQLITFTRALSGGGTVAKATTKIANGAAVAADFVIDCVQLEEKADATSYTDGSLGTGNAWTGTAHASASTRTGAVIITAPASSRFNVQSGAYAARFLRDYGASEQYVMRAGVFGSNDFLVLSVLGTNLRMLADTPATAQDTLATAGGVSDDTWLFGYGAWTPSQLFAALGTDAPVSMARAGVHGSTSTVLAAGSGSGSVAVFNGLLGPVLIADRPLTTAERRVLRDRPSWPWTVLRDLG